jgi:hypothetical protein
VVRLTDGSHEANEHIPPSPGDRLLHNRIKELGLAESTEELMKGREVVVPPSWHKWPAAKDEQRGRHLPQVTFSATPDAPHLAAQPKMIAPAWPRKSAA